MEYISVSIYRLQDISIYGVAGCSLTERRLELLDSGYWIYSTQKFDMMPPSYFTGASTVHPLDILSRNNERVVSMNGMFPVVKL